MNLVAVLLDVVGVRRSLCLLTAAGCPPTCLHQRQKSCDVTFKLYRWRAVELPLRLKSSQRVRFLIVTLECVELVHTVTSVGDLTGAELPQPAVRHASAT